MSSIIRYILNMIPYIIVSIPIYLIVRFIILSKKGRKINWYHEITFFLFVLFIVGLSSQTIIPKLEFGINGFSIVKSGVHKTNLIPFKVLFETYNEVFINRYINYFLIIFLGNIIMFMPIGFFPPLLWNLSKNIRANKFAFRWSLPPNIPTSKTKVASILHGLKFQQ